MRKGFEIKHESTFFHFAISFNLWNADGQAEAVACEAEFAGKYDEGLPVNFEFLKEAVGSECIRTSHLQKRSGKSKHQMNKCGRMQTFWPPA